MHTRVTAKISVTFSKRIDFHVPPTHGPLEWKTKASTGWIRQLEPDQTLFKTINVANSI